MIYKPTQWSVHNSNGAISIINKILVVFLQDYKRIALLNSHGQGLHTSAQGKTFYGCSKALITFHPCTSTPKNFQAIVAIVRIPNGGGNYLCLHLSHTFLVHLDSSTWILTLPYWALLRKFMSCVQFILNSFDVTSHYCDLGSDS